VSKAGRFPLCVALGLLTLPSCVWAQEPSSPAKKSEKPVGADDGAKSKVSVSEHMTVDLHLKDEDLANVLELLSIQTQKNIVASKGVSGKVTATLYGVTFYQALDAILHVNGFGYVENGNFIFVYTNEELKNIQAALKKRISVTIRLNYINAEDAKEFVSPLLSKDGGEIKVNTKTKDFSIPEKAPTGKNDYALGDLMVVYDYEENVKAIEERIKQIDTRPQQVLVEATILQTSLNEANAFGVDFSVIGDINFLDFATAGGPLGAANALIKGTIRPDDNRAVAATSLVGNTTSGSSGFKVGVIAGDVGIFVRMLDSITDTVILSNPKILALNRQPARVLVGKRVGYLNTTQTETSTTQSVQFLDTGTQLYFRPFVSSEGEIRMELKPQVSSAEIRTVTDSGGRAVTIPDEVTQEMVTNVNVRDGQTIVLGGLFTENSTFTKQQVPWMGDLPILGAAFRGHDDSTVRSEIIFLITPSIVTDTLVAGSADRALAGIERVRAGSRQGLLPFSREKMTDKLNVEAEQLARDGKFDAALHKIQNSLSQNANQPEVYRLREQITGLREHWSDPSVLNAYLNSEVVKRIESIPSAPSPQPNLRPRGSVVVPLDKIAPPKPRSSAEPASSVDPLATTAMSGQDSGCLVWMYPAIGTEAAPASATSVAAPTPATAQAQSKPAPASPASSTPSPSPQAASASNSPSPDTADTSSLAAAMQASAPAAVPPAATAEYVVPMCNAGSGAGMNVAAASPAPFVAGSVTITQANIPKPSHTVSVRPDDERTASDAVRAYLPGLRGRIELFSQMNSGQAPNLGSIGDNGWADLVCSQLVMTPPANPYIGGPNASRVVVGEKPDTTFHTDYGWIFNPKTSQLWAAGFDAKDRPLSKLTAAAVGTPGSRSKAVKTDATMVGVETDGSVK
jgi:type IV pilus secretin PilQ/predicted competence protein